MKNTMIQQFEGNAIRVEPMKAHEYADLFPMMNDEELKNLVSDLKRKGQSNPIMLLDGKILDGRNRYKACMIAGLDPKLDEYKGTDPLGFVVSHNLIRRHLDESQRAMVAAKMANLGSSLHATSIDGAITQPAAAAMLNVSVPSVTRAKAVITHGIDEVSDLVTSGQVSVNAASHFVRLPEAEQAEIAALGVDAIKAKANEIRKVSSERDPKKYAKVVFDDAERLWGLARIHLSRILPIDKSREKILNEVIAYAQNRLSQNK